jgi:hypothetical protein
MKPLISLCIITGNSEEYMARCLASFSPFVDEIVVVRAIGKQTPDKSLEIAENDFGAIVGEYFNAPDKRKWTHFDAIPTRPRMERTP